MIVECSISSDSQIKSLIFHTGTDTEVDLWQTATQNHLVVSVDFTIRHTVSTTDILVEAVAYVGTLLGGMIVQVGLCTETERSNLSLQCTQVGTDIILKWMIMVTIGSREFETAVVHRCGIHGYRRVGNTCL